MRAIEAKKHHALDSLNLSEAELAVRHISESLAKIYHLGSNFTFETTCNVEAYLDIASKVPMQVLKIEINIQKADVIMAKLLDIKYNDEGFTDEDGTYLFWGPMSDNVFTVLKMWMPNTPIGNINVEETPGSVIITAIERYYYKVPNDYDPDNPMVSWSFSISQKP